MIPYDLSEPKYASITRELLPTVQLLETGDLTPSESVLQKRYHCSRYTIRMALMELCSRGYLRAHRGLGYVRTALSLSSSHSGSSVFPFDELQEHQGRAYDSRVTGCRAFKDAKMARLFLLSPTAKLEQIDREVWVNHRLAVVEKTYLPCAIFEKILRSSLSEKGICNELQRIGEIKGPIEIEETISPYAAPESLARRCGLRTGAPLMKISHLGISQGAPFEQTVTIMNQRELPLRRRFHEK